MLLTGEAADAVRAKIDEATKRRDSFLAQANQELASYNGAIAALRSLIEEPPASPNGKAEAPAEKAPAATT